MEVTGSLCWRHVMETHSVLLALHENNPSVTGEFPSQCQALVFLYEPEQTVEQTSELPVKLCNVHVMFKYKNSSPLFTPPNPKLSGWQSTILRYVVLLGQIKWKEMLGFRRILRLVRLNLTGHSPKQRNECVKHVLNRGSFELTT